MRVLVTGAGGPIGFRVAKKIIDERLGGDIEHLVVTEKVGYAPWFSNDGTKTWIKQDLNKADKNWWQDTIDQYQIDIIYYLETSENENKFEITMDLVTDLMDRDAGFLDYLRSLVQIPEVIKLKVVYLSTDKMYTGDKFPSELNDITIVQPEGNLTEFDPALNYAAYKITSELDLTSMDAISLRIIRPFSIVCRDQGTYFPLGKIVQNASTGAELHEYKDGQRGLTYTHTNDLAEFLLHPNLFDPDIEIKLYSRIINFCRTQNYLPEKLMIQKILEKTESNSNVILNSDTDMFPYMMSTPQIRNMAKIWIPQIPIEMILEEMIDAIDPSDSFGEVHVNEIIQLQDTRLRISGTADPRSTIALDIDIGGKYTIDMDDTNGWVIETDPYEYDEEIRGEVKAYKDGVQYDTEIFIVPAFPGN